MIYERHCLQWRRVLGLILAAQLGRSLYMTVTAAIGGLRRIPSTVVITDNYSSWCKHNLRRFQNVESLLHRESPRA